MPTSLDTKSIVNTSERFNTKDILLGLGKACLDVPKSVPPEKNPPLASMVIAISEMTRVKQQAEQPLATASLVTICENNLAPLAETRSTQAVHQSLSTEFISLKAQADELDGQRIQFLKDAAETVEKGMATFKKLAADIWAKTPTTAPRKLTEIISIKEDLKRLNARSEQLARNVGALAPKLKTLNDKKIAPVTVTIAPAQTISASPTPYAPE